MAIRPTESDAHYVLDGLYDHDTILEIEEHFTDTGRASDYVFALFALSASASRDDCSTSRTGSSTSSRRPMPIRRSKPHRLPHQTPILEHWDDLLYLASITTRIISPSTIIKRFSVPLKSSDLAKALRELGRIERTLFMIEWYSSPALRRRCQASLHKGEAAHKLKRAVFFHERGEVRDRSYDSY
ncbi:Tn3 family transposase (plasmid) [Rhizobium sp. T1470]|uniref:Tn3 family transposase n=1 Tax=unclassified Rhizobium TaxID=2613769 RepID=UPI001AB00320|nr:Tn3 family transposase [Rhizobium sp. T1473]MCA0806071.1 transposase [Rhizobium sp. T1473]